VTLFFINEALFLNKLENDLETAIKYILFVDISYFLKCPQICTDENKISLQKLFTITAHHLFQQRQTKLQEDNIIGYKLNIYNGLAVTLAGWFLDFPVIYYFGNCISNIELLDLTTTHDVFDCPIDKNNLGMVELNVYSVVLKSYTFAQKAIDNVPILSFSVPASINNLQEKDKIIEYYWTKVQNSTNIKSDKLSLQIYKVTLPVVAL